MLTEVLSLNTLDSARMQQTSKFPTQIPVFRSPYPLYSKMPTKTYLDPSTALEHLKAYERSDGLAVDELMNSKVHGGLTYNDFLMLPGKIDFAAHEASTESKVTRNVVIKTPFMSSPMDTVTEGEMAISMAVSFHHHTRTATSPTLCPCSSLAVLVSFTTTSRRRNRPPWCAESSVTRMASSQTRLSCLLRIA